ncbi:neutral sphingomyelinase isoform X2 [Dermatophagoides farinae]|uniref:neutral sphingomyelinase isoform X2 n=1 Tax=Dermatophagoides farinae TaxID=6954 RepID=UPI003F5F5BF8
MSAKKLEIDNLKIFTLNCWGLRYVSDHRQVRIKLIAQHLVDQDYDVVFLQEVWIQSDFEYIRTKTKSKYRFAHMFNNASLLGTSGLVIMAKWTPQFIHFHPYSINGSPFRPFHGDWFSTKGVAYVRIELLGLNLHLFSTHMHAQYDLNEKIIDQYSIHRICQAYELGKFINLMSCNCTNTGSKDLIILAGDMNTSSKELPYKMLIELTDLNDCYKLLQIDQQQKRSLKCNNNNNNNSMDLTTKTSTPNKRINKMKIQESSIDHESSDEELTTCGHRDNTFTPQQNLKPDEKAGKRIDFIFFKLRDSCSPSVSDHHRILHNRLNDNGISTMDILKNNMETILPNDVIPSNNNLIETTPFLMCLPEKMNIVAKDITGLSFSDHQPVVAKLHFTWKTIQDIVNESKDLELNSSLIETTIGSSSSSSSSSSTISSLSAAMKTTTNDIKCLTSSKLISKFRRKECYLALREHQPMYKKIKDSALIQEIETLLTTYVDKFRPSFNYTLITVLVMVIMFILILMLFKFIISLTIIETILMSLIIMIIASIGLLLKFITHRTEINAIKAILNDIQRKKTFHPDYGLCNE